MKLFGSKRRGKTGEKKKTGWPRVAIALIAVLAALLAGTYAAFELWVRPPEQHIYTVGEETPSAENEQRTQTETPDASPQQPVQQTAAPTQEPEPEGGYGNKNRYTFLIVGKEPDGYNTDTILVGTLDTAEEWLHVYSIPRDTLVNVPWWPAKINSVYSSSMAGYSSWSFETEMDGLLACVGDLMGYEPAYWAVIDIVAFEKLVDAIGGITFNIPYNMSKDEPEIHFSAGEQWLSGEDALKVVRYRDYPMGDIDRISVQQEFLKTLASEMLSLGNIPNIGKVYDVYEQYVETNLASGNIAWFVREFMKLDEEDICFGTLPGDYCLTLGGISFVNIYKDRWLETINNELSPLEVLITEDDLDIVTYSAAAGYTATSGILRIPQ